MWGKNLKEEIRRVDCAQLRTGKMWCESPPYCLSGEASWMGTTVGCSLDYGVLHTRELQLLSKILSHHGKGNHPCPLCDIAPPEDSVMGH